MSGVGAGGPTGRPDPLEVVPLVAPPTGTVALPGSKSITNRALVCAALADGTSRISGALRSEDTEAMLGCLRALGVRSTVSAEGGDNVTVEVEGREGPPRGPGRCSMRGPRERPPASSPRCACCPRRRWCSTVPRRCGPAPWPTCGRHWRPSGARGRPRWGSRATSRSQLDGGRRRHARRAGRGRRRRVQPVPVGAAAGRAGDAPGPRGPGPLGAGVPALRGAHPGGHGVLRGGGGAGRGPPSRSPWPRAGTRPRTTRWSPMPRPPPTSSPWPR